MRGAGQRDRGQGTEARLRTGGAAGAMLFLVLFLQAPPVRAVLVDRVVAAVNTEVITWSDLLQAVGFNEAVGGKERGGGQLAPQTLDGLINRKLLHQEARRLRFADVSPEEVAAEVEKFKVKLGSERKYTELLTRLDMTTRELSRMLEERLLVERFIERKIGLIVRVNHDEALAYFEGHREVFPGKRFSEVRKMIETALLTHKINTEVDGYLADLRTRAEIRINPPEQ